MSKTTWSATRPPERGSLRELRLALVLAALMAAAAVGGMMARPSEKTDATSLGSLEAMVPREFGEWREAPQAVQVVNPQAEELLDRLYSEVLTRTYVDRHGYRIMLSLAYGSDQRRSLQAHKPEFCYPAQGFTVHTNQPVMLATDFGNIAARRLFATLQQRHEPLTYWFTVGDKAVLDPVGKRLVELRYALTGRIPDGMLFRVSSIDRDAPRAYAVQQRFVTDLLGSVSPQARKRLSGLDSEASAEITALP